MPTGRRHIALSCLVILFGILQNWMLQLGFSAKKTDGADAPAKPIREQAAIMPSDSSVNNAPSASRQEPVLKSESAAGSQVHRSIRKAGTSLNISSQDSRVILVPCNSLQSCSMHSPRSWQHSQGFLRVQQPFQLQRMVTQFFWHFFTCLLSPGAAPWRCIPLGVFPGILMAI